MEKKYWVPALEKADGVLQAIADKPNRLRLIDLSAQLSIHKSSMFSLLQTMETLSWIVKNGDDTFALGPAMGRLGGAYASGNNLIRSFHREAQAAAAAIGETVQLARLEGSEVLYLAKVEVPSPIRLASDPGMKFPAHATALGKVLLAGLTAELRAGLYPDPELPPITPYSLQTREALFREVDEATGSGFATDRQEAVVGFFCVAAPVQGSGDETVAAVSCSMPAHVWERKQETAREEIGKLAIRLSGL
jgi:DNA-binding IclR family transcriptional regulator